MPFPFEIDEVLAAAESGENVGFCVKCGYMQDGVEPDARRYECEECGKNAVYGAEELVIAFGA